MNTQALLFENLPDASPPRGVTWKRHANLPLPFANYQMMRDGEPTGIWILHCGHPTANRPYEVVTRESEAIERKFSRLELAKLAAVMAEEDRYDDDKWIAEAIKLNIL